MLEQDTSIINRLSHNDLDTVLQADSNDWHKMISFSEMKKIITEFRKFTNTDSLTCQQYFFCGGDQPM